MASVEELVEVAVVKDEVNDDDNDADDDDDDDDDVAIE